MGDTSTSPKLPRLPKFIGQRGATKQESRDGAGWIQFWQFGNNEEDTRTFAWSEAVTHTVENVGKTEGHVLRIELKH